MSKRAYALSMSDDTFNAFKSDFDIILRELLSNMEHKGSDEGKLTATFNVSLALGSAPDFAAKYQDATRQVVKPAISHKITSVMQIKDEKTGKVGGEMELVWDGEKHEYYLRPLDNGQVSFDDVQRPAPEHPEQADQLALDASHEPGALDGRPLYPQLPPADDATPGDDVIEAEYTEVLEDLPDDAQDDGIGGYEYDEPEAG